jgi:hypothetical protein
MSALTEPQHSIVIEGVERRLRYRFVDWSRAERIAGIGIRSGWGVPLTTPAQMLPMMLLAGLNHCVAGLTLDGAAELVTYDNEDALMLSCVQAIYDYEPAAKKKLEAAAAALANQPEYSMVSMLLELIQSTIGTGSTPSADTDSDSTPTPLTTSQPDNSTALSSN